MTLKHNPHESAFHLALFQLYEDHSFLRKPALSSFLSHVLAALKDISVPVDPAMTKTLEQHFR